MAAQEIPLAGFRTKLLSRSSVAEEQWPFTLRSPPSSASRYDVFVRSLRHFGDKVPSSLLG